MFLLPIAIEAPILFPSEEKVLGFSWQVWLDQSQKFRPLCPQPPFLANLLRLALRGGGRTAIYHLLFAEKRLPNKPSGSDPGGGDDSSY